MLKYLTYTNDNLFSELLVAGEQHYLHNSFTIRLMSKPSAQGSDPVHGWVSSLHVLHFNHLKIGFLHNKGTIFQLR